MDIRKILNSMGFAGQLAKLGDVLIGMQDEIEKLQGLAKVKITFDSDGGSDVDSQVISYGSTATEPADPTKDGFVFSKWVDVDEEDFSFDTEIKSDITLTAVWEAA